eukprot:6737750-Prymnesium_polylepis.1
MFTRQDRILQVRNVPRQIRLPAGEKDWPPANQFYLLQVLLQAPHPWRSYAVMARVRTDAIYHPEWRLPCQLEDGGCLYMASDV